MSEAVYPVKEYLKQPLDEYQNSCDNYFIMQNHVF